MCTGVEIAMLVVAGAGAVEEISTAMDQRNNAKLQANQMGLDSADELRLADERANLIRKAGAKTRSAATAAYGASGVVVGEGSTLAVDEQIARDVSHDAMTEVLTGRQQARRTKNQADAILRGAKNVEQQKILSATGSLLSSGAQAYRSGWRVGPQPQQAAAPIVDRSIQVNR